MCIYIKDWFGGKLEWDCYAHALESEMWMTVIGQFLVRDLWRTKKDGGLSRRSEPDRYDSCKPKDRVATEDKNNTVYEIACSLLWWI